MTPRRAASVFFGIGLLAMWLAAAAGVRGPDQEVPAPSGSSPPAQQDRVYAEVQERTSQLRERLGSAPMVQRPSRNPFEFAAKPSPPPPPRVLTPAMPHAPALPVLPPRPLLNLAGVGEDHTAEGVVRTAVISGPSGLFLVMVGEEFLGRFRVLAIGADTVELTDNTDDTAFRLSLQ
jgi:hypothetical protein